jgi:hypothetical protein
MHPVASSKKMQNGVVVFWQEGETEKSDLFTWEELIEAKINALDLLDNSHLYRIDPDGHKIIAYY